MTPQIRPNEHEALRSEAGVSLIDDAELFGAPVLAYDQSLFVCPNCEHGHSAMLELGTLYSEVASCADCGIVLAA